MRRFNIITSILLVAFFMSASIVVAEVPQMINYQGRLTDDQGDPVNATVSIAFTIYNQPSGGTVWWTETHASVQVSDGSFNVILGGSTEPIDDSVFSEPDRYLGIAVNGDPEIEPRTRLVSVGYSHVASTIDIPWEVTDYDPDGLVRITYYDTEVDSIISAAFLGTDSAGVLGVAEGDFSVGVYGAHTGLPFNSWGYLGGPDRGVEGYGRTFGVVGSSPDHGIYGYGYGNGRGAGGQNNDAQTVGFLGTDTSGVSGWVSDSYEYAIAGLNGGSGNYGQIGTDTVGVFGHAENSDDFAVFGKNDATGCIGYLGYAYGVSGVHTASGNGGHIGGANYAASFDGDVGIGTELPSVELHVIGDICYTGNIAVCSDVRYKKDIEQISAALETITQLRGVTYNWKLDEYPNQKFDDQTHFGFIAQEIKELLPGVVMTDDNGYMSVDYSRVTPVLVEAMKELKTENDELRDRLAKIEAMLEQLVDDQ